MRLNEEKMGLLIFYDIFCIPKIGIHWDNFW